MAGDNQPLRYCAYVLRCWEERRQQDGRPSLWRFSLEDASTGVRHGFATLDGLFSALQHEFISDYAPQGSYDSQPVADQNYQESDQH